MYSNKVADQSGVHRQAQENLHNVLLQQGELERLSSVNNM
jgi:hypothetical protein